MSIYKRVGHMMFRPLALALYLIRKRRRFLRNFPVRWYSQPSIITEDLAFVPAIDGSEAIGEKFLDRMVSTRDAAASQATRLTAASVAVSAYFLLGFLSIDVPISVLGVELKRVPGLDEVLLLTSAAFSVLGLLRYARITVLEAAIRAAIRSLFPPSTWYLYEAALLPRDFVAAYNPKNMPHIVWHKGKVFAFGLALGMALVFLLGILLALVAFRTYVAWRLWHDPSTDNALLHLGVLLAIVLDLGALCFSLAYTLPLPHRDYSKMLELERAELNDPGLAADLKQEMYGDEWKDRSRMVAQGYLSPLNPPNA